MEGLYFYWWAWVVWIYATFLQKKTNERTRLAATTLLFICGSIYKINIASFSITYSFLFLFLFSLIAVRRQMSGSLLFSALTVAFFSVSIRLLAIADPIIIWADERWLLAIGTTMLVLFIERKPTARMLAAAIGSCQGDIVYAVAVRDVFPSPIGSLFFFDVLALTGALLFAWSVVEHIPQYMDEKQLKRNKPL
ncbi:hypothetical protein GGR02_000762 [Anoxybacillus voinovskiensis]|uniref:Transmembrane protein n=1 Tax=Anoxybacteroides voinovskiense TaxID=230470 RepID=A0A840DI59_9BACL|nr:hypothetical protein [Anoxybacillus voinovskiensis]MBB4073001.1 hypothetical protein [Anoxybacillus voinovskiensis]GGJ60199.1 hypothetical protein GCM10008982_06650 [Anoxybacillus voinovskiensis]